MISSAYKPILCSLWPREIPDISREEPIEVARGIMQRTKTEREDSPGECHWIYQSRKKGSLRQGQLNDTYF